MPLLFSLIAAAIVVGFHYTTVGFFSQSTSMDKNIRESTQRSDLIRELGPVVRQAFDLSVQTAGACTANTVAVTVTRVGGGANVVLCWPFNKDVAGTDLHGCIQSTTAAGGRNIFICPKQRGSVFYSLNLTDLILPIAHADVKITQRPPAANGPSTGVHINVPNCSAVPTSGGQGVPCIDCSNTGSTTCLQIKFCISEAIKTNCTDNEAYTQTFAFRDY